MAASRRRFHEWVAGVIDLKHPEPIQEVSPGNSGQHGGTTGTSTESRELHFGGVVHKSSRRVPERRACWR